MKRIPTKPFRQSPAPKIFCVIDAENIRKAVVRIERRINEVRRAAGAGVYVFIDSELSVYLLPDTKTCAEQWVITYFTDLVGYYSHTSKRGVPILKPTAEGIAEDIEDHLRAFQ